jgi:HD domain
MTAETERQMTASEKVDELEESQHREFNQRFAKSVLYTLGEQDPSRPDRGPMPPGSSDPSALALQGDDPRLQKMPERPTLLDFFKYRWGFNNHLLQSATHALKAGCDEKTVLACLLHDIGVAGFIRSDHGYWGEQLVKPYVDEEVSWAIRAHQVLRFYADESVGYTYPEMYIRLFGEDFKPEPYIEEEYQRCLNHKWYMTGRQITINDIYSFDPDAKVNIEDFYDIIGRNFHQPEEGLGFDNSPVAHMWRTIIWPTRFL